jgi:hypothetical protein
MSNEAVSKAVLIREFTRELHNKNAAIFAGAGLSLASGYVDWKGLLRDLIEDLELNPDDEDDLVTLAQYHCNQAGGNKSALTQKIFDHFSQTKTPIENHNILSKLPIQTYWTTNYDKLIEMALVNAKKVPDVKYTMKQLAVTRLDRDASVYKMHGDIDHASEAVISKDDYEAYPLKMSAFVSALRGDLIEKTFLFLGFSFTDPNLDYILSRVRVLYEQHQRQHYCIIKRVSIWNEESAEKFKSRKLKQHYFIKDLKRFGIQTVLVDDYSEITDLLKEITARFKQKSIFISGAADDFGSWDRNVAENFLHGLSYKLLSVSNRVVTGFGLGVGSPVINGALACLNDLGKTISDDDIVMRPFPQVLTGQGNLPDYWKAYRQSMLDYAGMAIFVFGNKTDIGGNLILSNGMRQEFDLAIEAGLKPLPVGTTGFMAEELWREVSSDLDRFLPGTNKGFRDLFSSLGDTSKSPDEIIEILSILVDLLQRG